MMKKLNTDQPHDPIVIAPAGYDIGKDVKETLHALMDQHERGWRGVAAIVDAVLEVNAQRSEPAPVMAIYQAVAYECGKRLVTIRSWHHYYTVFSPVWDELPCLVTITHLRQILSEAIRRECDPLDVLRERIEQAAEYGRMIPPDAYDAELRGLPADWGKRKVFYPIDRAVRSLTTAIRLNGEAGLESADKQRIAEFVLWLESLQKRLGGSHDLRQKHVQESKTP